MKILKFKHKSAPIKNRLALPFVNVWTDEMTLQVSNLSQLFCILWRLSIIPNDRHSRVTGQNVHERRLAGSRTAQYGSHSIPGDRAAEVVQDFFFA